MVTSTCKHCGRRIVYDKDEGWIDPEAGYDDEDGDGIWRTTCDAHDTFIAEHEPIPLQGEMCQNCRDAVTREGDELVGSDGEVTCPESTRPHGPAIPDVVDENGEPLQCVNGPCDDFAPDAWAADFEDRDICTSCFYRKADHATEGAEDR